MERGAGAYEDSLGGSGRGLLRKVGRNSDDGTGGEAAYECA